MFRFLHVNKLLNQNIWLCFSNLCIELGTRNRNFLIVLQSEMLCKYVSIVQFYFVMRTIKWKQFLNRSPNFMICKRPPERFCYSWMYWNFTCDLRSREPVTCNNATAWSTWLDSNVWIIADLKIICSMVFVFSNDLLFYEFDQRQFTIVLLIILKNLEKEVNYY